MLDMLMKQILGDIDMEAVKATGIQFVQKFNAMAAQLDRIEAKLDAAQSPTLLPSSPVDTAQGATLPPNVKESNHDDGTSITGATDTGSGTSSDGSDGSDAGLCACGQYASCRGDGPTCANS